MAIRWQVSVFPLLLLCLFGCSASASRIGDLPVPAESEVYIVPQAGNGISLVQSQQSATRAPSRTPAASLYAAVPDSYVVSQVVNRNLDQDTAIEQVALYRDARNGDYIQILVVDYDRRRDSYIRAWEGRSTAQNTTGAEVDFFDLTGDNAQEILIYGRDQSGTFTLDVFEIEFSSEEAIISLVNIGTFRSESAIGIELGILPQIVLEEELPVSYIDQAETEFQLHAYQWSPSAGQFYQSTLPTTANPEISQQFFQQLIQTSVSDLLHLVVGDWIAEDGAETVFLIINDSNETLNLQIDQRQIAFRWKGLFKTVAGGFPTIHLTLLNEHISSLISQATITLLANDEIRLNIQSEPTLSRAYRRITAEQIALPVPHFINSEIELSGWYEGVWRERRVAVYFYKNSYLIEYPNFGREIRQRGVFSTYKLDMPVLELVELDNNRLVRAHQQYLINYQQRHEGQQLVRALELKPIIVRYHGYHLLEEPVLQLVQVVNIRR